MGGGGLEQVHQTLTQEQHNMLQQHAQQIVQESHNLGYLPEQQEMHGQLPA